MDKDEPTGAASRGRAFCVAACALALGLLGWRAVELFTSPSHAGSDAALVSLLEPIAGPGKVRASRTQDGVLILLDSAAPLKSSVRTRIERVAAAAAGDGTDAPRAVVIETFPFARGAGAAPTNTALLELAMIAIVAALSAAGALSSRPASLAAPRRVEERDAHAVSATASTPTDPSIARALQFASAQPDRTAAVIRGWLSGERGSA